jgi:hypothetical protein
MRRSVKFTPGIDGNALPPRIAPSDLPLSGIGQDGAIQAPPPPNITIEPAPEPYNPYWDSFKVGFADGLTGVLSYGTYTYSSGFVAPPQTTAPTTP